MAKKKSEVFGQVDLFENEICIKSEYETDLSDDHLQATLLIGTTKFIRTTKIFDRKSG